jgi:hypothetical protein
MCRAESSNSSGAAEDASDPETAAELQRDDEPTCSLCGAPSTVYAGHVHSKRAQEWLKQPNRYDVLSS